MMLQFQRGCIPPFEYKQYTIWDDVSVILILSAYLILYIGVAYCLMRGLKAIINTIKSYFIKNS